jgi:hypothetical protein
MASLQVPKKHHRGLQDFLELSENSFQSIINSVDSMELVLEAKEILAKEIGEIKDIEREKVSGIADAIISISFVKATSESSNEAFINDLTTAIEESSELATLIDTIGKDKINQRLEKLFAVDTLAIATKARSIMYEYDNIYYRGRVITDIRPVFNNEADAINAALIIHSLRIHYHVGDTHQDFFVALDTNDLQQLIDVLERSKAKAEKLKTLLDNANISYFNSPERK